MKNNVPLRPFNNVELFSPKKSEENEDIKRSLEIQTKEPIHHDMKTQRKKEKSLKSKDSPKEIKIKE